MEIARSCLTLCDPQGPYSPRDSPGKNTGVGSLSLLQGTFLAQEWNRGLLHCRWILYQLSSQGSHQRGLRGYLEPHGWPLVRGVTAAGSSGYSNTVKPGISHPLLSLTHHGGENLMLNHRHFNNGKNKPSKSHCQAYTLPVSVFNLL